MMTATVSTAGVAGVDQERPEAGATITPPHAPPNNKREAGYDSDDTLFMPSDRELEAMKARVMAEIDEEQHQANEEMQHEASQTVLGRPVAAATQEEARENAQIIGTVA